MWRTQSRDEAQPAQAVPPKVIADADAIRTDTQGNGIFRGLRASFTKRKPDASTDASSATEVMWAHANMEVTPGDGPSRFQFLDIKNLGEEGTFHAEGQIISSQNTNSVLTGVYPMGWGRERDAWIAIPKGATRQILIATIGEVYAGSLFHMALIQAGPSVERHWARWNAQEHLPLPRFGLRVSITAEGAQESWIGYFSVTPENQEGVGVRVTFRGLEEATDSPSGRLDGPKPLSPGER